ncbi:MFS transporter small subunit [Povalibacter sp.]
MKARLIILWLIVGLPLLWGIARTLANSMKLFL